MLIKQGQQLDGWPSYDPTQVFLVNSSLHNELMSTYKGLEKKNNNKLP